MQKRKVIVVLALVLCLSYLRSQPFTLKIWETQPPMSRAQKEYYELCSTSTTGERVSRVTEPTLTLYLPSKELARGTAILIIPGGGYAHIAMTKEGTLVAQWLNEYGIAAAVLKYRLPSDSIMENKTIGPLQDAQEAMRILRRNAREWNIDPNKIGVMGFSAGGHLASTLCTRFAENVYVVSDTTSARPNFSILLYPVISMDSTITHSGSRLRLLGERPTMDLITQFSSELRVSPQTPPTFLVHALDDTVVPVENSLRYFVALQKLRLNAELHVFQSGGHGFGLATARSGTEKEWRSLCLRWLEACGWK